MFKKYPVIPIFIALIFFLVFCNLLRDSYVLGGYTSSADYYEKDAFREFTNYAEYYYNDNAKKIFEKNHFYKRVTAADIPELDSFFEDFSHWIVFRVGYEEWFDFDYKKQLKENDFYVIEIRTPSPSYEKFTYYKIYYFDVEQSTLYFFESHP